MPNTIPIEQMERLSDMRERVASYDRRLRLASARHLLWLSYY
jgi:hypothetical protein